MHNNNKNFKIKYILNKKALYYEERFFWFTTNTIFICTFETDKELEEAKEDFLIEWGI